MKLNTQTQLTSWLAQSKSNCVCAYRGEDRPVAIPSVLEHFFINYGLYDPFTI